MLVMFLSTFVAYIKLAQSNSIGQENRELSYLYRKLLQYDFCT